MKIYKTLPSGIKIVEYEDSLAPAIAEMWNKSGEGWGGQFGDGRWTVENVIAQQSFGAYFNIYIAMDGDEAVGYCSLNRYYKDESTAYVHLLNVRPDCHGKGIGKELVLMCVNETIALGLPRVDIHTWPGNTKAVPMYKKCGFQWEDRTDTTHLSNFVPTVLSTELFADFFETANWYTDSSRKIEIKPDGKKVDKFELFEYEWLKDEESLTVGFETTGRRIWLVETNDYRVELTAENHELSFGLNYRCRFDIKNKTGKKLDITISAKNDGVISWNGSWEESVADRAVFESEFHVAAITDEQDKKRMHPCVLADVFVNGKHALFGLGIEPKFPIEVSLAEKRLLAQPGITEDVYINIKNNLPRDAMVKFTLPENELTRFEQASYEIALNKGKNAMLKTSALVTDYGYAGVPVTYDIKLEDGEFINVTRQLHLVNQGLEGSFEFETNSSYGAANGLWRLSLNKQDNTVKFDRLIPSGYGEFEISKLGKPFRDEFNIMEPSDVRTRKNGAFIVFEADFESGKIEGAVLTEVYEFDAAGTLKHRHRLTNKGKKPLNLAIQTEFWTSVNKRAVLHYDGDFHEVADDMFFGFDSLEYEKIDENWVFDMDPINPAGICWPKHCKLNIKWGDCIQLTFPIDELLPEQSYETEPVIYVSGVFKEYRDFRNYVLGIYDEIIPFARNHIESVVNGGNPVLSDDSFTLTVRNNRLKEWEGTVAVSSSDGIFAKEQRDIFVNEKSEEQADETVVLSPIAQGSAGVGLADIALELSGFEKTVQRALFITDSTQVKTEENNGVLTVANGHLQFSVAPGYSDAVYTLKYGESEWLYSRYPSLEPYSWFNPFVGGLKSHLERMGNSMVLREKITACFASERDNFGNVWTGIRADIAVEKFDEYKGMSYSQYYLTLPGVPVMCHFMRLENNTGCYMDAEMFAMLYLSGEEGLKDIVATMADEDKTKYRLRLCSDGQEMRYDRLIAIEHTGERYRQEKLYIFKDSKRDRGKNWFEYDINIAYCDYNMKGSLPAGSKHTTKPMLCILTEKELTLEALTDLSRIEFV